MTPSKALESSAPFASVIPLHQRTFREQTSCPWALLRASAVARRPLLAPVIDRVGDWIVPSDLVVSPGLVIDLAVVYLTHARCSALRGAR